MRWGSLRERFFANLEATPTGCVEWTGSLKSNGYGQIYGEGKKHYTHRLAWRFAVGPIPDGLLICHTCDNPKCVNVAHLFLGTFRDNMQDCVRKGRIQDQRGSRNNHARLTDEQVLEMRELYRTGQPIKAIARKYGNLDPSSTSRVVRGLYWRHLSC